MATKTKTVQAKEAILIVVGARPPVYGKQRVFDKRREEWVEIDYTDPDFENHPDFKAGDLGTPYAFKAMEKVPANHPAVKEAPDAFTPVEDE